MNKNDNTASEGKDRFFLLLSRKRKPLQCWNKRIRAGQITQVVDSDLRDLVLEIRSLKSSRTYLTCPADPKKVLAVSYPYLFFIVKNLERSFIIDVLIKDDKNVKRRITGLTKQSETQLKPYTCKMPLTLEKGWNQIILPLRELTQRAYGTKYVETLRVQLHATCRVQNIYFSQKPYEDSS